MRFERTTDWDLIRSVMTHPKLWEASADDFAPAREEFQPRKEPGIWYVALRAAGRELLGLFILAPQNAICWEIHARMLPGTWGLLASLAAHGIVEWIWAHTPCRRIVTHIPSTNRLAIRYAERAGFERYGVNPASWQKDGELIDLVLLGISEPGTPPRM